MCEREREREREREGGREGEGEGEGEGAPHIVCTVAEACPITRTVCGSGVTCIVTVSCCAFSSPIDRWSLWLRRYVGMDHVDGSRPAIE